MYWPFNPIIQFLIIYSIKITEKKKDILYMKIFISAYTTNANKQTNKNHNYNQLKSLVRRVPVVVQH